MKELFIYHLVNLFAIYIFILFVLRAIYFTFVIKQDPIQSVKIVKPTGLFKKFKEEQKQDKISKWG